MLSVSCPLRISSSGSATIPLVTYTPVLTAIANIIIGDIGADNGLDNFLVQDTGRLEYAICGEQMATLEDALNTARAGEVTVTKSAWKYVNQDLYPFSEPRKNCFILKSAEPNICADLPLMRRVRNEKLFSAPMESNPHYYKYVLVPICIPTAIVQFSHRPSSSTYACVSLLDHSLYRLDT